jgi:hypothetical protein
MGIKVAKPRYNMISWRATDDEVELIDEIVATMKKPRQEALRKMLVVYLNALETGKTTIPDSPAAVPTKQDTPPE